jgi:hypothetical protein
MAAKVPAHHGLAAGISKALVDEYGATVIADSATEIADQVVAYLARPKTQRILARFQLELIADVGASGGAS